MSGSERDPESIVRQLLAADRQLPAQARDEILALNAAAVPALLRVLNEDPDGWAPVHAVRLLGELKAAEAVEPMLRALAETESLDLLHDAVLRSLPEFGNHVVEPALRAHAASQDPELRSSISAILAQTGVRDDRIFAVLLELLERSPGSAGNLVEYGDDRALPYLSRAFDDYKLRDSDAPLANQDLVEIHAAIEDLGGTLTRAQLAKFRKANEPAERWRQQLHAALESRKAVAKPVRPRPGRNEPCWCGSARKYKKCHLAADEHAVPTKEIRL
jgi:HEAT repeat protein